MTLYGVDVSSHKNINDIGAVKAAGNDFLITKCTGGLTYKNPLYVDQIAKARGAKMLIGHYAYLHESTVNPTTQDDYKSYSRMVDEAAFFLANLDWRPGELVCVDVEDPNVTGNLSAAVGIWCAEVANRLGFKPLIYTYPSYIKERSLDFTLTPYPLWYAEYNEPMVNSPYPWSRITLRQYTASAVVPGIGADVDRNSFEGNSDDWRKLGMPDSTAPTASIVTPASDWGPGSKGRVVHRAETIIVINDDETPPKTYVGIRIDENQLPWQEVK